MKRMVMLAPLVLVACGVDGPPERPTLDGVPTAAVPVEAYPATYTDANGVVRTTGKTTSVGSDAGNTPADL